MSNYKNRPPYDPATDFYKLLREAIVRFHQKNEPKKALDVFVATCHPKKQTNYVAAIAGYKKFLGLKKIERFTPPTGTWSAGGITVSVNPELGLSFGGVNYVIKMYMKDQKLAPNRVETINHLMAEALGGVSAMRFGVLDVREAKVHATAMDAAMAALLKGEAGAAFMSTEDDVRVILPDGMQIRERVKSPSPRGRGPSGGDGSAGRLARATQLAPGPTFFCT